MNSLAKLRRQLLMLVGAASAVVCWGSLAQAYCRSRTCVDDLDGYDRCRRDSRDCISEGATLVYPSGCLSFAVARGEADALGLTDQELLSIVEQAFARWQSVDCGNGQTPGLFVQSAGLVVASGTFYCEDPSLNFSVWHLDPTWRLDAETIGNTALIYDEATGEVLDADVELNLVRILEEAEPGSEADVLLSVATHEAGHFLGLAHSDQPDAIMFARYDEGNLVGRPLSPDDVDGVCEAFPPEHAPTRCPKARVSEAALDAEDCADAIWEAQQERASAPASQPACSVTPLKASVLARSPACWTWAVVALLFMRRKFPQLVQLWRT